MAILEGLVSRIVFLSPCTTSAFYRLASLPSWRVLAFAGKAQGAKLPLIRDIELRLSQPWYEGYGLIRAITSPDGFKKPISKDAALERRLQPVTIEERTVESTISIICGLKPCYELTKKRLHVYAMMEDELWARVVGGQDHVVTSALIASEQRPTMGYWCSRDRVTSGVVLVPRPTGVGKTELCKALPGILFNHEHRAL
ncbi:hypothetical protein EI94DRAFT_1874565 [Lactarius quietus]|nr:hypothetical protein EI94DRAFT_1874565 [Lactarius quietus]